MKRKLRVPSPAMGVACIALAVALSGASYAAVALPKNSVGTKQLRNNAVQSSKIAPGAVNASHISGAVPSAARAQSSANADLLDNKEATDFYAAGSKVDDSLQADKAELADNAVNAAISQIARDSDRLGLREPSGYLRSSTYHRLVTAGEDCGGNQSCSILVSCEGTDTLVTGGFYDIDPGTTLLASRAVGFYNISSGGMLVSVPYAWAVDWKNNSTPDEISVSVICTRGRVTASSAQ